MKRFLSLTLVAVMLLSTLVLSSCNLLNQAKDFVHNLIGIEDGAEGRTTITKEELETAFDVINYELHVGSEDQHVSIVVADTVAYLDYFGMELYIDITKGAIIGESNGTYYGVTAGDVLFGYSDMSLSEVGYGLIPDIDNFDELVYDEAAKVYTYKDSSMVIEMSFLDGKIASLVATAIDFDMKVEIKNVGTTTLELPKYVDLSDGKIEPNKAPASAVTTVTKEQYEAAFGIPNYTLSVNMVVTQQISKYTETAIETSVQYMGSNASSDYEVLIDGVWHDIYEKYNYEIRDYEYVASPANSQEPDNALAELFGYLTYEDLVYNAENRYYTVKYDGDKYYLYFENGSLTQIVMFSNMGSNVSIEVMADISDVGTTVVELPEYTIYRDPNAFTESEWNELMASNNFSVTMNTYEVIYSEENGHAFDDYVYVLKLAENGYKATVTNMNDEEVEIDYYLAFVDGEVYYLNNYDEATGMYIASKQEEMSIESINLGGVFEVEFEYSQFTYNEYLGRYEYNYEDAEKSVRMYLEFDDGKLISAYYYENHFDGSKYIERQYTFNNFGTTVVELPEYTIAE